jgi:NAD-dependent dihydropyrimidine dehydrogenase PreA subunit
MDESLDRIFVSANPAMPNNGPVIDPEKCIGCNRCVAVCRTDVLLPKEGSSPEAVYPDECWFCGCCVEDCPVPGAIRIEFPLNQRVGWKRKETGEFFRIGMRNPLPPNEKPPIR